MAVKRIYVHESIYSEFLQTFTAVTQSLVVGDGFAEGTTVGPISNLLQYNRVRNLISDGIAQGLAVIQNSKVRATATGSSVGYFVEPVIVNNPPDASRVVQEEQFGRSKIAAFFVSNSLTRETRPRGSPVEVEYGRRSNSTGECDQLWAWSFSLVFRQVSSAAHSKKTRSRYSVDQQSHAAGPNCCECTVQAFWPWCRIWACGNEELLQRAIDSPSKGLAGQIIIL